MDPEPPFTALICTVKDINSVQVQSLDLDRVLWMHPLLMDSPSALGISKEQELASPKEDWAGPFFWVIIVGDWHMRAIWERQVFTLAAL